MTVKEIFELRKQGHIEEAYEAIRPIYATQKDRYTTLCMFWTAHDILKKRLQEGRREEAVKIFLAMQRLAPNIDDKEGRMHSALQHDALRLGEDVAECPPPLIMTEPSMPTTISNRDFGQWGEELAANYLESRGYRILERDWHSGHRDIDIIARNVDCVVFVEVKTRRSNDFGEPYEAVNYQKRRNLISAINHYIKYKRLELRPRFDIISITAQDPSKPEIVHIEDIKLV